MSAIKTKIFVNYLPDDFTENDLYAMFEEYGEVIEVNLLQGCGFVLMSTPEQAAAAVKHVEGCNLMDSTISVETKTTKGESFESSNTAPSFEVMDEDSVQIIDYFNTGERMFEDTPFVPKEVGMESSEEHPYDDSCNESYKIASPCKDSENKANRKFLPVFDQKTCEILQKKLDCDKKRFVLSHRPEGDEIIIYLGDENNPAIDDELAQSILKNCSTATLDMYDRSHYQETVIESNSVDVSDENETMDLIFIPTALPIIYSGDKKFIEFPSDPHPKLLKSEVFEKKDIESSEIKDVRSVIDDNFTNTISEEHMASDTVEESPSILNTPARYMENICNVSTLENGVDDFNLDLNKLSRVTNLEVLPTYMDKEEPNPAPRRSHPEMSSDSKTEVNDGLVSNINVGGEIKNIRSVIDDDSGNTISEEHMASDTVEESPSMLIMPVSYMENICNVSTLENGVDDFNSDLNKLSRVTNLEVLPTYVDKEEPIPTPKRFNPGVSSDGKTEVNDGLVSNINVGGEMTVRPPVRTYVRKKKELPPTRDIHLFSLEDSPKVSGETTPKDFSLHDEDGYVTLFPNFCKKMKVGEAPVVRDEKTINVELPFCEDLNLLPEPVMEFVDQCFDFETYFTETLFEPTKAEKGNGDIPKTSSEHRLKKREKKIRDLKAKINKLDLTVSSSEKGKASEFKYFYINNNSVHNFTPSTPDSNGVLNKCPYCKFDSALVNNIVTHIKYCPKKPSAAASCIQK